MKSELKGYVYILTNPSFPNYVKIGYADNAEERLAQLNRSECTPFAFRLYATLEVEGRLKDVSIHNLFDKLNPTLRSKDEIDGKIRVREFYAMTPEDAFELLGLIADIWNNRDKLKRWSKSREERADERTAAEINKIAKKNRHHFREIEFTCSLTGHRYRGKANDEGTLEIIDLDLNVEIPNNANPSKKVILGVALEDLGQSLEGCNTTYQRYRRLQKILSTKK